MQQRILLAAVALLVAVVPLGHAEEEPVTYHQTAICAWHDADLRALIIPPAYGSLYEKDPAIRDTLRSVVVTAGPVEAPWENEYTRASIDGILAWERAMREYAAAHPEAAHLADVEITVDVVSPDFTPPAGQYDVVVVYPPVQEVGGRATQVCGSVDGKNRPSVIMMSTWFVYSFTVNDMHNVVMHEFGHSLGLDHVTDAPKDPMQPVYGHFIGTQDNPRECPSTLNVAMLAKSFAWVGGAPWVPMPSGIEMSPADYARLCG